MAAADQFPKSTAVWRDPEVRSMLDALPHIAWLHTADGEVVVNARWRNYIGSDASTPGDFLSRVHPNDRPRVLRSRERRQQGEIENYDVRVLRSDGMYRWHQVRSTPFRRRPDESVSWIGTTTDVHEERTQARVLSLLLDLSAATRRLDEPEAIVAAAVRALSEALGLDRCAYARIETDENTFHIVHQSPTNVGVEGRLDAFGFLGNLRRGQTAVVDNVHDVATAEEEARMDERGSRAFICVPLIRDGKLSAVLSAHAAHPRLWSDDEVEAVRLVADRCWAEIERGRAEREARERENRLRALVEANPIGVVVVDIETGFALEANDAWLEALGRTREELEAGEVDVRAMSADDGVAVTEARIALARQGGKAGFYEKVYLKPDGTRVPVLVGFTPVDPAIKRATAFMLDLSDLRRAEQAVEEGERRYRLLAETIPSIAFTLRPDGEVEYVNTRGDEYFGPGLAQAALAGLGQAIAHGESFKIERPLLGADRQYRWHLCRAVPMRDEVGAIVRWIGTLTDVHEAKSRERVLRFLVDLDDATAVLEDPMAAMRETAYMLAGAVGADRCVYAEVEGDAFTVLGDYARNLGSIVGEYRSADFGEAYVELMGGGRTFVVEDVDLLGLTETVRAAYREVGIAAVVSVPIVKGGNLVAKMAVHQARPRKWSPEEIDLVQQVAERSWINIERVRSRRALRESEERLREANDSLERKVADRTAELEAANEALQGFGYHVSHDLRTPLRAIVSTSRMIQADYEDVLPADANALLSRQAEAARKLGELIDDLLQLSRLSQAELKKTDVDLTAVGRDAAGEAMMAHPESTVRIEVEEGLRTQADPRLLRLAIVNLLENAVKYSPEGGTVRLGRREDGTFTVTDEGIGMEGQYLERIFEPFQRLHRDEAFKGTGIGLANVRRVITRHGGRVWAESELGKGSAFLFRM